MTAVLSATDPLRRDRVMAHDDNQINYSSSPIDWRAKYLEADDMLAEARAELEDFQHSSKDLEEELERELERTEKAQQELKVKAARAETERDEWKSKFMSLQTTHNSTTTSLQRELDTLRHEHQQVKVQLRDLEMGNDDLERNERAISSSLADIESKYSRALEEKILLEHELMDKANLEEETQRLKDELRDANEEVAIMKDQLAIVQEQLAASQDQLAAAHDQLAAAESRASTIATEISTPPSSAPPSDENLLRTAPPPDMQLSDLSLCRTDISDSGPLTPVSPPAESSAVQAQRTPKVSFQPPRSLLSPSASSPSTFSRSRTVPSPSKQLRNPPRTPAPRPTITSRNSSTNTAASSSTSSLATASRSKGVQMVSEMRARVKNLEQKIHTRVPRLRMGSVSGRNPDSGSGSGSGLVASTSSPVASSSALVGRASSSRRSADNNENERKRISPTDTSGWVLIMEDSPTPVKDKEKEKRRRSSSPLKAPSAFRSPISDLEQTDLLSRSRSDYHLSRSVAVGLGHPPSRTPIFTDGTNDSTTTALSSIPSSRPVTPTFLPVPASGMYSSTAAKRTSGPGVGPYFQPKRSSLGTSTVMSPHEGSSSFRDRPSTMPPPPRSDSEASTSSARTSSNGHGPMSNINKALPHFPGGHSNVTVRPLSKIPYAGPTSVLSQSRIGRPSGGRRSGGESSDTNDGGRLRSGSTAAR